MNLKNCLLLCQDHTKSYRHGLCFQSVEKVSSNLVTSILFRFILRYLGSGKSCATGAQLLAINGVAVASWLHRTMGQRCRWAVRRVAGGGCSACMAVARSLMVSTHASTNRVHAVEAFACACVLTLYGACKWSVAS